ncbi:MAG: ABC transporter substrate-binding protein [Chloroflexi bacterium]|nr:ABC transporter substrate-binding protein [Chloroflexota bacterium]
MGPTPPPTAAATPTPLAAPTTPAPTPVEGKPPVPTPSPTPRPPHVLRTAELAGWEQLDPHKTTSVAFYHFFGDVYSGLVRWETGPQTRPEVRRVVPDLAVRWEQVDAQTYLFRLQPEARWHDLPPVNGRRVTGEDVAFSIRRLALEGTRQPLWRRFASAQAVGEDAVQIVLTGPYPSFLPMLASGFNVLVAPEAVRQAGGDLYQGPVVGTGPFLFDAAASHRESRGVLLRNPTFYEPGTPRVDRLERLVVGTEEGRLALLRAGRLDFALLDPFQAQVILDDGGLGLQLAGQPALTAWALSFKPRAPFQGAEVRRAASLALDREALWRAYSGTRLPLAVGTGMPLPSADALLSHEEIADGYRMDVGTARRLLQQAGVAPRTSVIITIGDYGERPVAAGLALVQQLRAIGLGAEALVVLPAVYAATVQAPPGLFQVAFGPVVSPEEADLWLTERFGPGGSLNAAGIADPELTRLIQAQQQAEPGERAELLRTAQRLLLERALQPAVFLDQTWAARRPDLEGWSTFLDEPFQRFLRGVGLRPAGGL